MSERSAYDSGLCCMARHASAVPPWTCDCSCHTRKERDTTPPADLPQRSASELARALRMRANHLSGEAWEVDATAAMMREAADMLSSTPPADYTSDEALQMIGGSEGCGPGSLRELVAAWFYLQARRVEADGERAVLLKALLGVRSPARGYPCWCDESHNSVEHGHQPKCIAALAALRPAQVATDASETMVPTN